VREDADRAADHRAASSALLGSPVERAGLNWRFSHCHPTRARLFGSHIIELYAAFASGQKHSPRRMLPRRLSAVFAGPHFHEVVVRVARLPSIRRGCSRSTRRRWARSARTRDPHSRKHLPLFHQRAMRDLVVLAAEHLGDPAMPTARVRSMSAIRSSTTFPYIGGRRDVLRDGVELKALSAISLMNESGANSRRALAQGRQLRDIVLRCDGVDADGDVGCAPPSTRDRRVSSFRSAGTPRRSSMHRTDAVERELMMIFASGAKPAQARHAFDDLLVRSPLVGMVRSTAQ